MIFRERPHIHLIEYEERSVFIDVLLEGNGEQLVTFIQLIFGVVDQISFVNFSSFAMIKREVTLIVIKNFTTVE